MRKLVLIVLMVSVVGILLGQVAQLPAPTNLRFKESELFPLIFAIAWDEVEYAGGYHIHITDTSFPDGVLSFNVPSDWDEHPLAMGLTQSKIRVKTLSTNPFFSDSEWAETIIWQEGLPQLPTPTNVRLSEGVITWDAVANANGYLVRTNGSISIAHTNRWSVPQTIFTNTIYVKTRGDLTFADSEWNSKSKLSKPTNVRYDESTFSWDAVPHAVSYRVNVYSNDIPVNVDVHNISETSIDIPSDNVNFILLWAVGNNFTYTDSEGVWYLMSSGLNENDVVVGTRTELKGNYPNPFNPETSIQFSVVKDDFVTIDIYNAKGQKVRSLVNEKMTRGNHNAVWNGKDDNGLNVSSGVYFYQMRAGEYQSIKRMILMK